MKLKLNYKDIPAKPSIHTLNVSLRGLVSIVVFVDLTTGYVICGILSCHYIVYSVGGNSKKV